jgi:predicted PurR-regulated permease PerM
MNEIPPGKLDELDARVTDLVIRLLLLGLFAYLSLMLVRPFLPMLVWAVVLAVSLAPVHDWLARHLGGSRRIAATLLTLAMLAVVVGPVAALAGNLVENVQHIVSGSRDGTLSLPALPARLATFPLVGEQIVSVWTLASTNLDGFVARYREFLAPIGTKLIALVSTLSLDLVKFAVSIIIAGVLLVPGARLAQWGRRIASRIVAPRGEQFVDLATVTIRNVSRGVVGVALLQSILIGIVLLAFGIPSPGLFAFLILILCILQVGPALVVLPMLIWAWAVMTTGEALLLTILLVPLTLMDNVLKPMLMGRGLATPTLVIFLGVLGGTVSFGMIGLFLGPVVLAVFYDLVISWLGYGETRPSAAGDPDGTTP